MDRCGLFVDAGYLFAAGGELCCGERRRSQFDLNAKDFIVDISEEVREHCELPLLRAYWYDGAKDRIPTPSQLVVAALPSVKLRLGSMNGKNQQKGVDALIYRDLMTLSRERAIAHAFVLSGDEDLREGVHAAQEMGVRVTLIGISPVSQPFNQSRDLVHEADDIITLEKAALSSYFTKRKAKRQDRTAPSAKGAKKVRTAASAPRPPDAERTAMVAGKEFGERWRAGADETQRQALVELRPKIPPPLDAELLKHVEDAVGIPTKSHEDIRRSGRRGFWQGAVPSQRTESN